MNALSSFSAVVRTSCSLKLRKWTCASKLQRFCFMNRSSRYEVSNRSSGRCRKPRRPARALAKVVLPLALFPETYTVRAWADMLT